MKSSKPTKDRTCYYDGYMYDKLVSRQTIPGFRKIASMIDGADEVLDIGCGVGTFSSVLADRCKRVVGVDASSMMIAYANKKLDKSKHPHLKFIHCNGTRLSEVVEGSFDVATITVVLHETEQEDRQGIVRQALEVADKVLISDFSSPFPSTRMGRFLKVQEFLAGLKHFRNFRTWMKAGGIDGFVRDMGLRIIREKPWGAAHEGCGKFVMVSESDG